MPNTGEISEQQVIATILVNQRIMRNGSPPIVNALDLLPAKLRDEVMGDAQAVVDGLKACRIPGDDFRYVDGVERERDGLYEKISVMRDALEAVRDSDMAMREEDEGRVSKTLNLVRVALGKEPVTAEEDE